MAKAVKKAKKPVEKKKKEKVEMVRVPLLEYLKLKPDDFENPNLPLLFKLSHSTVITKGGEDKVVKLIADSMKSFDYVRKYIYDAVNLYEETINAEADISYLNGLS